MSNGNEFTFDWTAFYTYIDSLNLIELSALFHISVIVFILILLSNIFSVFFSKQKYPKLYSYFKLRLK